MTAKVITLWSLRGKNCRDEQGVWDPGGGGLEFGDTIEDTLRKEVKEEYCTNIIEYEFLGYRDVFRENAGKKTHWLAMDFRVLVDASKVKNGEPHKFDEVKWFQMDKLPHNVHSQMGSALKLYREKLK